MNSQTRYEMSNNIVCFAPLSSFTQQTSDATTYQQVNAFFEGKKITIFNFRHVVIKRMKDL
jgi:hypothetical protein